MNLLLLACVICLAVALRERRHENIRRRIIASKCNGTIGRLTQENARLVAERDCQQQRIFVLGTSLARMSTRVHELYLGHPQAHLAVALAEEVAQLKKKLAVATPTSASRPAR